MRLVCPAILLLSALVAGCADDGPSDDLLDGKGDDLGEGDKVKVGEVGIEGGMLSIEVTYLGGETEECVPHEFTLDWDETYTDTTPPGAELTLIHERNGDTCRDRVWTVLQFDLTNLAYAYMGEFGVQRATVPIALTVGLDVLSLDYTF